MLRIRLRRAGNKNNVQYRIVVANHTSPVKGKFIDWIGSYNPHTKNIILQKEKLFDWIEKGALTSNTVAKLMKNSHIEHPRIKIKINQPKPAKSKEKITEKKESESKKTPVNEINNLQEITNK